MCGIVGKLKSGNEEVTQAEIRRMCDQIAHRGPDDEGVYIDVHKKVGLGSRRLAILNLSAAGHMPMSSEDGRIQLSFNGEILNYQEYLLLLRQKGHKLIAGNDTDVIIHLYEEYELKFLDKLRGFFALAIWDERKQRLILARDRLGKKPLFYAEHAGGLIFGSELASIVNCTEISREPNWESIDQYLAYQAVPSPNTAFRQIKKLPAGHFLVWQAGKIVIKSYWQLGYLPKTTLSYSEAKDRLKELFEESVQLRMISDVPLGAFLSGGVDSSAVVATMSRLSSHPVKTFSIGFNESGHDELSYAREVAARFGADHHEFHVTPKAIDVLPELVRHYGEPYADPSALPTYYLSKLTKEYVTVALNGDGGDENFGGYTRYQVMRNLSLAQKLLPHKSLQLSLGKLAGRSYRQSPKSSMVRELLDLDANERYSELFSLFGRTAKHDLLHHQFLARTKDSYANSLSKTMEDCDSSDLMDQMMFADLRFYVPEILMPKVDIASMAVSLEVRSPLLDHKLVEFAATLPSAWKLRGKSTKHIFKDMMRNTLPSEVLYRPKHGFSVPLNEWFRGELKKYARELLFSPRARDRKIFEPEALERLWDDHQRGVKGYGSQLWALVSLELWFEMFQDK